LTPDKDRLPHIAKLGPKQGPRVIAPTTMSKPTQTLLDNARAIADWIAGEKGTTGGIRANVDLMLHDEKITLTKALREMVHARSAELALRGQR